MNDVEQFANVAGPSVGDQTHHRGLGDDGTIDVHVGGEATDRMIHQKRDVLPALPQCRDMDLGASNPEEEVVTKLPRLDHRFQVPIGGADESDVGPAGIVASQPDDITVFKNSKKLRLHAERHVSDLIEKDRPTVRVFEDTLPVLVCAGEGAANMTEELILEKGFTLTSSVEGHVFSGGPLGDVVHRGSDQFLARS